MNQTYDYTRETTLTSEAAFLRRVYNWMVAGLALTGGTAYLVASSPSLLQTIFQTPLFYVLIFGELGMVFYLSARIQRMSSGTASAMFIIYSVLNGLTLAIIFLAYTRASIASAFFVTAGTFGVMSVYGYTTKNPWPVGAAS